jgi:hydrogenase expression/formation protein HypD
MKKNQNNQREKEQMKDHIQAITATAEEIKKTVTLMEICGGHTNVIMKYGIRDILPKNIRLISGPGCPVCVSAQHDIDCMIALAQQGIPIATYGDMLKVPGSTSSLDETRACGGKIFEVYSTTEVEKLRKKNPNIVFFGVGFETTAPMTAYLLEQHVCVYSTHKLIPPALCLLAEGTMKIDGFIDPGHVSTIIGVTPYKNIKIPQVITGFSPEHILRSIRILLELIQENKPVVVNAYPEAVREDGNRFAQALLKQHFIVTDSEWRGLGMIPGSGLDVRNNEWNAKIKYQHIIKTIPAPKKTNCRCGDVLKGFIEPPDCPLYKKICTPDAPQGACMVSPEGSCAIYYHYGK